MSSVPATERQAPVVVERLAGRHHALTIALVVLIVATAVALWVRSLPEIDLRAMNDLGLASVLPVSFFAALVLLSAGFAVTLFSDVGSRRRWEALLFWQILLVVVILYGTPALVEEVPRTAAMWRHLGVANLIEESGSIEKTTDGYLNWPGFFVLLAVIRVATGLKDLAGLGAWAPVFFNVLYLFPLLVLFRRSFQDFRFVWLAVWIFLCTNWVGQDYLAPQGFGYFMYLVIFCVVVVLGRAEKPRVDTHSRSARRWIPMATTRVLFAQRAAMVCLVAIAFTAVAISHQLTPYAVTVTITALVAINVSSMRALPIFMTVIVLAWFTYSATPFLTFFLNADAANIGGLGGNFAASITDQVGGTQQHEFVIDMRRALTGLLWLTAAAGVVIRFRGGHRDWALLALGVAPFILIGLQRYGGEILLRVYFFTLPAAAFFAAALVGNVVTRPGRLRSILATTGIGVALLTSFFVTRYGFERADYFTKDELAAVRHLYRIAPRGARLLFVVRNLPWRYQSYSAYDDSSITNYANWGASESRPGGAVVIHHPKLEARDARFIAVIDAVTMSISRSPGVTNVQKPFDHPETTVSGDGHYVLVPFDVRGYERGTAAKVGLVLDIAATTVRTHSGFTSEERARSTGMAPLLREIERNMRASKKGAFLTFTRGQEFFLAYTDPIQARAYRRLRHAIQNSPRFRCIYRNRDAAIYTPARVKRTAAGFLPDRNRRARRKCESVR